MTHDVADGLRARATDEIVDYAPFSALEVTPFALASNHDLQRTRMVFPAPRVSSARAGVAGAGALAAAAGVVDPSGDGSAGGPEG